jgi:hypothetical protein
MITTIEKHFLSMFMAILIIFLFMRKIMRLAGQKPPRTFEVQPNSNYLLYRYEIKPNVIFKANKEPEFHISSFLQFATSQQDMDFSLKYKVKNLDLLFS